MGTSTFILSLTLGLALAVPFVACKKDDKEDEVIPGDAVSDNNGETARSQVYTNNLDASKPLFVIYGDSLATEVLANTALEKTPTPHWLSSSSTL